MVDLSIVMLNYQRVPRWMVVFDMILVITAVLNHQKISDIIRIKYLSIFIYVKSLTSNVNPG